MPLPKKDKAAHSGFINKRCYQKSKTGISVAPLKGLMSSKHLKKKNLACEDQNMRYGWCFIGDIRYLQLSEIAVRNNNVSFYRASL